MMMMCDLCIGKFDNEKIVPYNLSCGHSFCLNCIRIYQKDEIIECPKCQMRTDVDKIVISYGIIEAIGNVGNKESCINDNEMSCMKHNMEFVFYCEEKGCEKKRICSDCYIEEHNGHLVKCIEEDKNDDETIGKCKEQYEMLGLIRKSIEEVEERVRIEEQNQIDIIENMGDCFKNNKGRIEKIINDIVNKEIIIIEGNNKKNKETIDKCRLYYNEIDNLINKINTWKINSNDDINIVKYECEFREFLHEINFLLYQSSSFKLLIPTLSLNINKLYKKPKTIHLKEILQESIKNKNNKLSLSKYFQSSLSINSILFLGDSRNQRVLKYNLLTMTWTELNLSVSNPKYTPQYSSSCTDISNIFNDLSSSALFSNDKIILTGGCNYKNYSTTAKDTAYILIYNPTTHPNIYINQLKPLQCKRFSHCSCVINSIVYVFGGHNGKSPLSSMEAFDPKTNQWTSKAYMNIEREMIAYALIQNRFIFVFGGFNSTNIDSIERYDSLKDKWIILNSKMKQSLQNVVAIPINQGKSIALVGGYNNTYHTNVDIFNVSDYTWSRIDYMAYRRRKCHVYYNEEDRKMYIFGGESTECSMHIPEVYDFSIGKWSKLKGYDWLISTSLNFWASVGIND